MRTRILLTALLFCSLAWNTARATETEPNNTWNTASTLALNGSNSGIINPTGDIDWWKVTTSGDGLLSVTLTPLSGKYTYAELYDTLGTIKLAGTYSSGAFSISSDGLAKGTYYIKVFTLYSSDTSSYSLSNTLTVPTQAIDVEPNGTRASAKVLPLNGSKTGHIGYYYNNTRDTADWYKVTTTADGLLTLTLTPANGQYVYLTLYDNDGSIVLGSTYSNAAFNVAQDGLAAGTYYAKINCYYTYGFAPYTLSNTLVSPSQANDAEPDSTRAQALTLPLNGSTTGHVGYYVNNYRDTVDWYKVTTNADGLLRLSLTPANGQYTYITLYDNNGTTQLNTSYSNAAFSQSTDGLAAGTYYVKVNCYYTYGFAPYTLSDSLFSPLQANDTEPDSTRALALTLPLNGGKTGHVGYYYNNHRDTADWYKVTTNADGQLRFSLTPANGEYVFVYLYDNNGTTLLNSSYSNGPFNQSTDGLAAGTYYVRVNCYYNNKFAPYTLSDSLFTYANATDAEPNNVGYSGGAYLAKTMPANGTVPGHIGFYYNNQRDSTDWHKINYTGSGALTVTVNFEPTKAAGYQYTYLQVFKDTLVAPIYSNYTAGPSLTASLTSLTQGYYWVRITPYYTSGYESYSITNTFTQTAKAAIKIVGADTATTCTGTNLIAFKCSKSSAPYTVQLYRYGVAYGAPLTIKNTATFQIANLPIGSYYATAFGDGATGTAFGKSPVVNFVPPVSGISTTNITQTSARTNWATITCARYYTVQYHKSGDSAWLTKKSAGNVGIVSLTGLTANTSYTWRVQAVDTTNKIVAVSAFTDSLTFTTDTLAFASNYGGQSDAAISKTTNSTNLLVYPNPAVSQFRMQFNAANPNEKVAVALKDINGKTVWNINNTIASSLNSTMVDISKLSPGIYLLQITGSTGTAIGTTKIVVSH